MTELRPGSSELQPLTAALLECLTLEEVAAVIVERGMAALGAVAGLVVLVTQEGSELELIGAKGFDPSVSVRWRRFAIDGDYPLSVVVRERRPLFMSTAAEYFDRFPHLFASRTRNTKAVIDLPLISADRVFGALHYSFPTEREFTDVDRDFAVELSRLCALAMSRASARDEAEQSRRRLEFLVRASDVLTQSLDFAVTLNDLARLVVPEICDYAQIAVVEPSGSINRMVVAHEKPEREALVREMYREYPPDRDQRSHTTAAMETGRTLLVSSITDEMLQAGAVDKKHLQYLRDLKLSAVMTTPLSARGTRFGAISYGTSTESGRKFDSGTVALLEELTRRAAIFIDNVRLYSNAQEEIAERETAERERERAVAQREAALVENTRLTRAAAELSEQQRDFLKSVLSSVTDGRLILCDTKSALPQPLTVCRMPIPLRGPNDIYLFRKAVKQAAEEVDLPLSRCADLLTASSEAAMNAFVHAGGGYGRICTDNEAGQLQIWILDNGKGIEFASLPEAVLRKGYSSAGTLGHGFKMIHSFADRVYILTGPQGTTVVIEQHRTEQPLSWS